jgi:hypothetical protein
LQYVDATACLTGENTERVWKGDRCRRYVRVTKKLLGVLKSECGSVEAFEDLIQFHVTSEVDAGDSK